MLAPSVSRTSHANDRSSLWARQQTGLPERAGQKIVRQRQLADLGMQRLHVDCWLSWIRGAVGSEQTRHAVQQLAAPSHDLFRVDVEKLRQLGKRLLALHGSQCHLRLECRTVVRGGVCSSHLLSCSHIDRRQAENPLITPSKFSRPPHRFSRFQSVTCAGFISQPRKLPPPPKGSACSFSMVTRGRKGPFQRPSFLLLLLVHFDRA